MFIESATQGKKRIVALLAAIVWLVPGFAVAEELPSAGDVLAPVRMNQFATDVVLGGQLRAGSRKLPFEMRFSEGVVVYDFASPAETLRLRTTEEGPVLEREVGGKKSVVEGKEAREPFRDTDITLEDVSLRFLFWKNASVEGEQIIGPYNTWKVKLAAPSRSTNYAAVFVFIGQSNGALMQMDAYGWDGKIAKRFKVVSGQKIDGLWALKQMRVESMKPGTKKVKSRTYLEIKGKVED